jgi:hypothetical protein
MDEPGRILCPWCEAEISPTARKCRYCGEWVRTDQTEDRPGRGAPVEQTVESGTPLAAVDHIHPESIALKSGSMAFAVVTLIFYLLIFPVGLLLNMVGLFTGPRRGCFAAMFGFFVALPVGALISLAALGIGVGIPIVDDIITDLSQYFQQRDGTSFGPPDRHIANGEDTDSVTTSTVQDVEGPRLVNFTPHDPVKVGTTIQITLEFDEEVRDVFLDDQRLRLGSKYGSGYKYAMGHFELSRSRCVMPGSVSGRRPGGIRALMLTLPWKAHDIAGNIGEGEIRLGLMW